MAKIKRSEKYFANQKKTEALMPGHKVMWQIEDDRFDLTCYFFGGKVRAIVQNFYDGGGIFNFLTDNASTWTDAAMAIGKNLLNEEK
jgi:hypothetical protein